MLSAVTSLLKKWEAALVSNMPRVQSFISVKKKEKDQKEVIGNLIKAKSAKSRFAKEHAEITTRLYYDERGLDSYYGLLELGEKYEVFKKVGNRYEIGEAKVYPKSVYENPEKYFTPEVMQALDECAKKEFSYGS